MRSRAPAPPTHERIEAAARAIARAGLATPYATEGPALEPQPAPSGPGQAVAGLTSAVTALGAIALMLRWPVAGALLLVAVAASAWVDAHGGRGWLRRLLPRRVSYNLIVWPCPLPRRVEGRGPCLLLCAPLARRADDPGPAARLLVELARRLRERPPEHLEIVVALLGGGADGLEVLLQNHRARLSPERTRVLCLHPGAAAWVTRALRHGWRAERLHADPGNVDTALSLVANLDELAGSQRW